MSMIQFWARINIWKSCLLLIGVVAVSAQYQGHTYEEPKQQYQPQPQPQQYREPVQYTPQEPRRPLPVILMHKQALTHDGAFNYAFAADNGLQQGETINPDGSRTGSYSYVDPHGKTISVKYSAGKDGFKVLEGDHVPKAPQPQAVPESGPAPGPYSPPQGSGDRYSSQAQYRAPPSPVGQFRLGGGGFENSGLGTRAIFGGNNPQVKPPPVYRVKENFEPTLFRASSPAYPTNYQQPRQPEAREEEEEPEHKGPHTFGGGYSFEFQG